MIADDNRDLNDHPEDDLKRQRSNYNGDQLYSNVSIRERVLCFSADCRPLWFSTTELNVQICLTHFTVDFD